MNIASKRLFLCLLVLASPVLLLAQTLQGEMSNVLSQLEKATQVRDHEATMVLANQALNMASQLENESGYVLAMLGLAQGTLGLGDAQEAMSALNQLAYDSLSADNQVRWQIQMGEIQLQLGRSDKALTALQAARQQLGRGTTNPRLESDLHATLGVLYWNQGDYQKARDEHRQSLILREQTYGADTPPVAGAFINLGLVDASEGQWDAAAEAYERAIQTLEAAGAENTPAYRSAQTNLGVVFLEGTPQLLSLAEESFAKARAGWVSQVGEAHPNVWFLDAYLARVSQALGYTEEALATLEKVQRAYEERYNGLHPELANIWNLKGQILLEAGRFREAVAAHQGALAANHTDYSPAEYSDNPTAPALQKELAITTLQFKAEALEALYFNLSLKKPHLEAALAALLQADRQLRDLRRSRTRESDRLALGALASSLYEDGVRVCEALAEISINKQPYHEQGLAFAEAGKAAVLAQSIAESNARSFAGVPNEVVNRERELTTQISYYEQRLAQDPYHEEASDWKNSLSILRREHDGFINQLETDYPAYYALKYADQTFSLAALQQDIPANTALVSFYLREKDQRLSVYSVTEESFQVAHVPIDPNLEDWITAMRNYMLFQVEARYGEIMYPLYQQLFPKSLRNLKEVDRLILIPHQQLALVPWEALITQKVGADAATGDMPFLLQQYAIQYSYSVGLYQQLKQMGEAQGQDGMYLMAPVDFPAFGLNSLPGTLSEVNNISKITAGSQRPVTARTAYEASELILRLETLNQYPYLHLATHGVVDPDAPSLSKLYLHPEDRSSPESDGEFFTGDIYSLDLDAELVSLSACETGLGQLRSGEGLVGLSRAFFYAGSRRLLVSLWAVNDQSTALLATQFYYYALQEGLPYSEALRKAKLEMIRGNTFAAPYYWAPFVLIGK